MATYIGTNNNETVLFGYNNLYGADGDDALYTDQTGTGYIEGGRGNDILGVFGLIDTVLTEYGGDGNDICGGGGLNDIIYGGNGNDLLVGSQYNYVNGVPSTIQPNLFSGDDYLDGG